MIIEFCNICNECLFCNVFSIQNLHVIYILCIHVFMFKLCQACDFVVNVRMVVCISVIIHVYFCS